MKHEYLQPFMRIMRAVQALKLRGMQPRRF